MGEEPSAAGSSGRIHGFRRVRAAAGGAAPLRWLAAALAELAVLWIRAAAVLLLVVPFLLLALLIAR